MPGQFPTLDEFEAALSDYPLSEDSIPFDRMMFYTCGEASRVRAEARKLGGNVPDALRSLGRACARIYSDPNVSVQRKQSVRAGEWVLRAAYEWHVPGIKEESATRFFDAWARERSLKVLAL